MSPKISPLILYLSGLFITVNFDFLVDFLLIRREMGKEIRKTTQYSIIHRGGGELNVIKQNFSVLPFTFKMSREKFYYLATWKRIWIPTMSSLPNNEDWQTNNSHYFRKHLKNLTNIILLEFLRVPIQYNALFVVFLHTSMKM